MSTYAPVYAPRANQLFVDGSAPAAVGDGSQQQPFATIAEALAVYGANDRINIAPGVYAEDVLIDTDCFIDAQPGTVVITGEFTIDDADVILNGPSLVDDGVTGTNALHITGVGAHACTLGDLQVDGTAAGLASFSMDNPLMVVELVRTRIAQDVANANEALQVESGTLEGQDVWVEHASNVAESIVAEGDAATSIRFFNSHFVGTVAAEAAVGAPAVYELHDCHIAVGAVSGVTSAATCTVMVDGGTIASGDAGGDALDGAGAIVIGRQPVFTGTADEAATTLTVTRLTTMDDQVGVVAAAGGSPQTDAVTLPQPYPDVNYIVELTFEATAGGADNVVCSVDEGTIAEGGFSVITTSISAAAIAGNVHWHTKRSA